MNTVNDKNCQSTKLFQFRSLIKKNLNKCLNNNYNFKCMYYSHNVSHGSYIFMQCRCLLMFFKKHGTQTRKLSEGHTFFSSKTDFMEA